MLKEKFPTEKIILELKRDTFFVDEQTGEPWVKYVIKGNCKTSKVNSQQYRERVSYFCYWKCKEVPSRSKLDEIINTLVAYAKFEKEKEILSLRVAEKDGNFYYDLSNCKNEKVEITTKGFSITTKDDVIFKHFETQLEQKVAEKGISLKKELGNLINLSEEELLVLIVYIVYCFIPCVQNPIVIFHGEKGNGKSTISTIIKEIVDPSTNVLTKISNKEEDLFLEVERNRLLVFDNESCLSDRMSDNLCRIVTGGSISKRKLYSDSEVVSINLKGCVIINGIENIAERDDLLSRSLIFQIEKRKSDVIIPQNELMAKFKKKVPYMLNKIFKYISRAMAFFKNLEDFECKTRMAEFEKWGYCIAEAMGGYGNKFLGYYRGMVEAQETEAIEANTIVTAIDILMNQKKNDVLKIRPSDLFKEIKRIAYDKGLSLSSSTMPSSTNSVKKKIKAYQKLFYKIGFEFEFIEHTRSGAMIIIKKVKQPSPSSH